MPNKYCDCEYNEECISGRQYSQRNRKPCPFYKMIKKKEMQGKKYVGGWKIEKESDN